MPSLWKKSGRIWRLERGSIRTVVGVTTTEYKVRDRTEQRYCNDGGARLGYLCYEHLRNIGNGRWRFVQAGEFGITKVKGHIIKHAFLQSFTLAWITRNGEEN